MLGEEENNSNIEVKKNDIDINQNEHKNMGLPKLISLFAIGFVGLIVISFTIGLFLYFADIDEGFKTGITNFITYGILLIIFALVINKDVKLFKDDFKKWTSYLMGLAIAILLIAFSIIYANIINLFRHYEVSDNETSLRSIINVMPVLSIIFFCFIGPVCEELTYRVGLFNIFAKRKWLGYLIAILVFAFAHFSFFGSDIIGELINLPVYLLSAFALTFAYDKFGLSASLTAHTINNLYAIISYLIVSNL